MTQYGFHFDGTRCTGCKTCVLACKDKNNLPNDLNFRNVYAYGGGTWSQDGAGCWIQDTFTYHVSVACNHCDMPLCMANCPQGAIENDPDTGEVRSDPEKCIGCGTCAKSIEELRAAYGDDAEIAPLPAADETKPNLVITAPAGAKPVGDSAGEIMNELEIM